MKNRSERGDVLQRAAVAATAEPAAAKPAASVASASVTAAAGCCRF